MIDGQKVYGVLRNLLFDVLLMWAILICIKYYSGLSSYNALFEKYGKDIFFSVMMIWFIPIIGLINKGSQITLKKVAEELAVFAIFVIVMIYLHK